MKYYSEQELFNLNFSQYIDIFDIRTEESVLGKVLSCDDFIANAQYFLKGVCHIFAYALNQRYGYKIKKYANDSHYFCIYETEEKKYYIDIRGITSYKDSFLRDFPYIGFDWETETVNAEDIIPKGVIENLAYIFANAIIDSDDNQYDVMKRL